jgi:hypothetical protein
MVERSNKGSEIKISDLSFADDIALLANNIDDSQTLLLVVEKYGAEVGLVLNAKKTFEIFLLDLELLII